MIPSKKHLYEVVVTESWTKTVSVEAESEEEAYDIVDQGISDGYSEYAADMGGDYHRNIEVTHIENILHYGS